MRNMLKPFFMKCHPDVQKIESAREINGEAIKNLNAFLDSMEEKLMNLTSIRTARPPKKDDKTIFEIDFCIMMEERLKGKKEEIMVRRKVELVIPTSTATTTEITPENLYNYQQHIESQIIKLLYISGIQEKPPPQERHKYYNDVSSPTYSTSLEDKVRRDWDDAMKTGDFSNLNQDEIRKARKIKYQRNRQQYGCKIDPKKFRKLYNDTIMDLEADSITIGLIRDDPKQRMAYIADILSRVRISTTTTTSGGGGGGGTSEPEQQQEGGGGGREEGIGDDDDGGEESDVDPISQLISLRRLAMLLDENFDDLCLEEVGSFWDKTTIVLTSPRNYNTSPSALYRKRKRKTIGDVMANDGFSFALSAHDNRVTIHIPVDFRDEELLPQLKRHVQDYIKLVTLDEDEMLAQIQKTI